MTTITMFECVGLEEFLVLEARAQAEWEYHHPPTEDHECKHCGKPLGLDDDDDGETPYRQTCDYCGRGIWE